MKRCKADCIEVWIYEKSNGRTYVYGESSDHHIVAENSRRKQKLKRLDEKILSNDCDVTESMPENSYFVLPVGAKSNGG